MTYKYFHTERLVIQPTGEEDAEFFRELRSSPKWIKYIGGKGTNSVEETREYIRRTMLPQLERLGYSNYTLIRKKDQRKVGICGLYDRQGVDGLDLGFALLPRYEKMGYAYESSNKLVEVAFNEFKLKVLAAITTPTNIDSQKLLEKLGFRMIDRKTLPNENRESLIYRLINDET